MSWIILIMAGGFFMWAITHSTRPWLDAVLVRLSGGSFVAAGVLGAGGAFGGFVTMVMGWTMATTDDLSKATVGTALVGAFGALLGILWVLAMLPDKLFNWDAPDWLVIGGYFFPSLLIQVTGNVGEALRFVIIDLVGEGMIALVSSGF